MKLFSFGELYSNGFPCSSCGKDTSSVFLTDAEELLLPEKSGYKAANFLCENRHIGTNMCWGCTPQQYKDESLETMIGMLEGTI